MKAVGRKRSGNGTNGRSESSVVAIRAQSGRRCALQLGIAVLLVVLALRTWVVLGLFVPVTVAGGSMAETLMGPHRRIVCAACETAFCVGLDRLPAGGRACCPRCGYRENDLRSAGDRPGQRLLIDRTVRWRGGPQRWQVVVFRCPEQANTLGVKRVVGLPGESVRIRRGDVFINGQIARKNLQEQRAVAQLVYRVRPDRRRSDDPRWRSNADEDGWQLQNGVFYHHHRPGGSQPGAVDWLNYHHPAQRPVQDDVSYNQGQSRKLNDVTDLMLTCLVATSGSGQLLLAADAGCQRFELRLPHPGGDICLYCRGRCVARAPIGPGTGRTARLIELSLFDAQLLLAIDGTVHLRYTYDRPTEEVLHPWKPLAVGARKLDVVLRNLTVWRDIYYTRPPWGRWGLDRACRLGADEIFVLGDNSPISADSRSWPNGAGLPRRLVVGTPIGVKQQRSCGGFGTGRNGDRNDPPEGWD